MKALNILLTTCLMVLFQSAVYAHHVWNGFHWASMSKPISLLIVDSVSADWDSHLVEAISQWSQSSVLNPLITEGDDILKIRKDCNMINGTLHVCNADYGITGWVGHTVIGFDVSGHIDKARMRLNDSYSQFWNFLKRDHVMCHELGHVFGLAHTSQDGSSQQTCMDLAYSDPLSQWPNQHDFVQLKQIYAHKDEYNSYDDGTGLPTNGPGLSEPPKGSLIAIGKGFEIWLAPREDGGFWIQHILLAPED